MSDIIFLIGTRPELIKVAPVIKQFKINGVKNYCVVNLGQHKELLKDLWQNFNINPYVDLKIMEQASNLSELTSAAISKLNNFILELPDKPKLLFAQGDTTSVMSASLVAFYNQIPFAHLEAGLRTYDMYQPYPEEFNRRAISLLATLHFTPTNRASENLEKECVPNDQIFMVGNTIVDALEDIKNSDKFKVVTYEDPKIQKAVANSDEIVLITIHRRENQNNNLLEVIAAIEILAKENVKTKFILPVHKNPNIKDIILNSSLNKINNVLLTEPLDYLHLLKLISKSKIILSDSGGIQEEAPSFKVPLLILRDKTERPEAVELGYSKLIGCNKKKIIDAFYNFSPIFDENSINPYGDGKSSNKIYEIIKNQILFK